MSTKSTIALVGNWHLYKELAGSDWTVHLEFPIGALRPGEGTLAIEIPIVVWRELRQHTDEFEARLTMSPVELRKEAEAWVKKRLDDYNVANTERAKAMTAMFGCMIADINEPFEQQVQAYIRCYTPPESQGV